MQVSDLKDVHKGQAGFVAGAGPSLHFFTKGQIDKIQQFPLVAVNSAIVKFQKAKYFLSDDVGVSTWSYYTELLPKLSCIKLLYEEKLKDHCGHLDNCCLFSHTWWYSPKDKKYNSDGLKLNKTGPIIGAINSAGSAVHFLYIMGCSPIVLIGCDCCYKDGNRYFWQYEGEDKPYRTKKAYRKGSDNYYESFYENKVVDYWSNMARLNPDVNIIDASDGKLNCFDKMNIDKVLEKSREIKKKSPKKKTAKKKAAKKKNDKR